VGSLEVRKGYAGGKVVSSGDKPDSESSSAALEPAGSTQIIVRIEFPKLAEDGIADGVARKEARQRKYGDSGNKRFLTTRKLGPLTDTVSHTAVSSQSRLFGDVRDPNHLQHRLWAEWRVIRIAGDQFFGGVV